MHSSHCLKLSLFLLCSVRPLNGNVQCPHTFTPGCTGPLQISPLLIGKGETEKCFEVEEEGKENVLVNILNRRCLLKRVDC